ncbi:hypothetical protein FBU59_003722 [Linderina macrospora]|uniref:Uncharacterized protein n=1 Tax=Linderina macrospora TaxID=4868 RepID=A0ACC1J7M9_9FUNG|nr:hypothetical protein FBU59_003722 [Linderina macrospora]
MSRPILPVNRYVERTAVKEGTCFICGYFTPSILVTENDAPRDWFFACPKHLIQPSLCMLIEGGEPSEPAKDTTKVQKDKTSDAAEGDDKKEKKGEKDTKDDAEKKDEPSKSPTPSPAPAAPKRKVYTLHRDYMYLRQRPFIQRWEKEQADLLAQRLPSVPKHRPA